MFADLLRAASNAQARSDLLVSEVKHTLEAIYNVRVNNIQFGKENGNIHYIKFGIIDQGEQLFKVIKWPWILQLNAEEQIYETLWQKLAAAKQCRKDARKLARGYLGQ